MKVDLIDCMGTDLSVVNAARVSFDKQSDKLNLQDERLIEYLAKNEHWTPFGHAFLSFRINAPIFVARQLVKHQVGLVWNEVSRRYVKSKPKFYLPSEWRKGIDEIKQGSSNESIKINEKYIESFLISSESLYNYLLDSGVCREQARMILPVNLYTEWIWSGSLFAFARVCNLRCKQGSQFETRIIANQIDLIASQKFPISWKALRK
jgi:thymidylate synthase (FAD)